MLAEKQLGPYFREAAYPSFLRQRGEFGFVFFPGIQANGMRRLPRVGKTVILVILK
jgi:hypothetical protein